VLYRYTLELWHPDLINSKGKPLLTTGRLEAVWKRLAARFATVVADNSMITLSNDYAAHFHDICIDGKENAKMTGDRMKMLMVRDLIAPEVKLINAAIDNAKSCSRLHGLPHVSDPSNDVCGGSSHPMHELEHCCSPVPYPRRELPDLQQKAVDLLDLLQRRNLPDKTGEKAKWNFEKAHSILHEVREIILWGNSNNTACQAPEVGTY
jgi:hypothetical protein